MQAQSRDPAAFWDRFATHARDVGTRLAAADPGLAPARALDSYFEGVLYATRAYDSALTPVLSRAADGTNEICFTADGAVDAFASARALAAAAPPLPGWRARALRERRRPPERLEGQRLSLDVSRMRFAYGLANDRIVFFLLCDDDIAGEYFEAQFMARRIVADLLGEEDFGLCVAGAQIGSYEAWLAATPGGRSFPLATLAERFDAIFRKRAPDFAPRPAAAGSKAAA